MANEVKKLNTIAIASVKNVNGITDANLKKLNTLEFTGYTALTWATGNTIATSRDGHTQHGTATDGMITAGYNGSASLQSTEEFNGSTWGVISGGDLAFTDGSGGTFGFGTQGAAVNSG